MIQKAPIANGEGPKQLIQYRKASWTKHRILNGSNLPLRESKAIGRDEVANNGAVSKAVANRKAAANNVTASRVGADKAPLGILRRKVTPAVVLAAE